MANNLNKTSGLEFEIRQKNSFNIVKYGIYQNNKHVGNINLRHLELFGKSYNFKRKWDLSKMYAFRSENMELGHYHWNLLNMILYLPIFVCDKIVIRDKEYKVCPRKKFSYNSDVFEKNSNDAVIKFTRKKLLTKNDLILFGNKIKKEDYAAFIGLLFFR